MKMYSFKRNWGCGASEEQFVIEVSGTRSKLSGLCSGLSKDLSRGFVQLILLSGLWFPYL